MISNLLPSVLGKASELGVSLFEETASVQLLPGASPEEVEIVIRAAYRQVLGNAHLMESDRLTVPESQLRNGDITVREFVRQVAQSELYRNRFFDNCPRLRFIELNFKHLLGRAPESHEELSLHSQILDSGSYWSEIDSYLDSDEYLDAFGENIVPYYRELQPFAAIGEKELSKWQSASLTPQGEPTPPSPLGRFAVMPPPSAQSLEQRVREQAQEIADLEVKIADSRRFAAIGEARLNKWRCRMFSR